ncbi:MAG: enoyl-CoA hydratase/isomerase family protein [Flavobacteriia bacterium]|nr:enoyl-CoA hydratase/isomerase family protein [Flavobacteriia bacterium]
MKKQLRQSTLENLGLGTVIDIFKNGKLPVSLDEMVDKVFGKKGKRGAMVISGANGIVGAGKVMQFASRLLAYEIPIIALDLPGSPDGLSKQFKGLAKSFGIDESNKIMSSIIRMNYDGKSLPKQLKAYNPAFLLEAIPEHLELKKSHYNLFKKEYPNIHIWSVTSGFPSKELGVGIAHPAFPHEINKIFEIVEEKPSTQTQLLWTMGLIPMQVSDDWSFVLDVFFCGLLQASLQFCDQNNMPYWKADKYIRKIIGPNPFRAHDVIGAKGSNFLTWSCLHHLAKEYGHLFEPDKQLADRKESGQNWYPANHFRPLVNRSLNKDAEKQLNTIVYGALFQMTSIMLKEKRADLTTMNAIGELCAQFTKGMLAVIRKKGKKEVLETIKDYHKIYPNAAKTKWFPEVFDDLKNDDWQQLYVNAEIDGENGIITISRESYNSDVNDELNRAIDWLIKNKIKKVILTGDFHFSTQMVGADTTEFYPAITDTKEGERIALTWSKTARRLHDDFKISVGYIHGKRCMGGMLELMMHCHYLIANENLTIAMPEITLPVVPGMEGCHWVIRKTKDKDREKMFKLLLGGKQIKANEGLGWLVDFTGNTEKCLQKAWEILNKGEKALSMRKIDTKALKSVTFKEISKSIQINPEAAEVIARCIHESCSTDLEKAIHVQAKISADFMVSKWCRKGKIGVEFDKVEQN